MISVNIISGIVIIGAILVIALRVLAFSGLPVKKNHILDALLVKKNQQQSFTATSRETLVVFGIALLFRIAVFIISIFAIFLMADREFSFSGLLDTYMQWDARNYFRIATGGYSFYVENGEFPTLAFFPLYPWIIKVLNVFIQNMTLSGLIVSFLAYSGACAYMYNLMSFDYSKQTAIRAIVFISVFPHSLFFGTMMNESMLLMTAMATLYYIRRHDWIKAGIFGALASMSRLAGIMLIIPATVEWIEHYEIISLLRKKSFSKVWQLIYKKALWIILMFLGTFVYLACNYHTTGEWFKFLEYQEMFWNNDTVYWGESISTILQYVGNEKSFTLFAIWLPELISIVFVATLLIYGIRRTRNLYTSFLVVYMIINMSMSWPLSIARYMTCAIPAFMILSDFSERHKWTEHLITATMAITFGIYFTAYFMSRQIL